MKTSLRLLPLALLSLVCCLPTILADERPLENESLGKLTLGMTAKAATELLGAADERREDTEWAATGDWVQEWRFTRSGLTLQMASEKKGGAKSILGINAEAPCPLATARGIRIGSSEMEVVKAYSDVHDKEQSVPGETFVAGSVYGGVVFTFAKGRVSSIFIGAAAE